MSDIRQTQFKRYSIWPFIFKSIKGIKVKTKKLFQNEGTKGT